MSDLVISNIIKVILIVLVVVGIGVLLYLFFKNQAYGFFKGLGIGKVSGVFFPLLN